MGRGWDHERGHDGTSRGRSERPGRDPYALARAELLKFLGACSPNSIIVEAARDMLREREASGLLERSRNQYRLFRERRTRVPDWELDQQYQQANREAEKTERYIRNEINRKSQGENGKIYKNAAYGFRAHVFAQYWKAAETILPGKTHIQGQMEIITTAAQTALGDIDHLISSPDERKRLIASEISKDRSQDDDRIYRASVAALKNNSQLTDRVGTHWDIKATSSSFTHYFWGGTEYFSVRHSEGTEGLYSVRTEAQSYHEISREDGEFDSEFRDRTYMRAQQIQSEEAVPERPDRLSVTITSHLDGLKYVISITKGGVRKGREQLQVRIWSGRENGRLSEVIFGKSKKRLIAEVLDQQLALSAE